MIILNHFGTGLVILVFTDGHHQGVQGYISGGSRGATIPPSGAGEAIRGVLGPVLDPTDQDGF